MLFIEDDSKSVCCAISFAFVLILMIFAICWTNQDNFENFTDTVKYNNDTIENVIKGGLCYKALGPQDNILERFERFDKKSKPALIAVMAPWCGYCRQLKASGVLTKVARKHPVLTLDDRHPQVENVMSLMDAKGFPALGIYSGGKLHPYRGPRDFESLNNTLNNIKRKTPNGVVIPVGKNYHSDSKKLHKAGQDVCTIFMADWCGYCRKLKESGLIESLTEVGFAVFVADDKSELTKQMSVDGFPTIYCMKGGKNVKYDGERTLKGIMDFVSK